ncbi:hypothetical protein GZL_08263 [Streptomyces sp. 769]|nr:hypothetical protein GZL_08263 [Streptomyces sp. 769]
MRSSAARCSSAGGVQGRAGAVSYPGGTGGDGTAHCDQRDREFGYSSDGARSGCASSCLSPAVACQYRVADRMRSLPSCSRNRPVAASRAPATESAPNTSAVHRLRCAVDRLLRFAPPRRQYPCRSPTVATHCPRCALTSRVIALTDCGVDQRIRHAPGRDCVDWRFGSSLTFESGSRAPASGDLPQASEASAWSIPTSSCSPHAPRAARSTRPRN